MEKFESSPDFCNSQEKEHEFASQMNIPRENWSLDFIDFVENKREMVDLEKKQDELIRILKIASGKDKKDWNDEEKEAYEERKRYWDILEQELKDKKEEIDMCCDDLEITREKIPFMKIMDIGCGHKAYFIEDVIKKMDSKNIYGLDIDIEEEILQKYPHNLYKGSYYEKLPVDNLDLITARASLVAKDLMQEEFLKNILDSLNEEGELRVYPLFKSHIESGNKEALLMEKELIEKLNEFSRKFNFDYQLKIKEISVYEEDEYPVSKNLLIIKKKKEPKILNEKSGREEDCVDENRKESRDLKDLQVIKEILCEGTPEELNDLASFHNFSSDQIKLFSDFQKLRKEVHSEGEKEFKKRILENPEPDEEELLAGTYRDEIEPQVRKAVFLMREKGYNTYESGFYGLNLQRIGVSDNSFEKIILPPEIIEEASKKEIDITVASDAIELFFNKYVSLEEIKKIWDDIADFLPVREERAGIAAFGGVADFRKRIEKSKEYFKKKQ